MEIISIGIFSGILRRRIGDPCHQTWVTNSLEQRIKTHHFETDSMGAMNFIRDPPPCHPTLTRHVKKIGELINRDWTVLIQHKLCEGNQVADKLANSILDTDNDNSWLLDEPLAHISIDLYDDAYGTLFPRPP
ncbi:hypothetical protein PIB30_028108 [Stylosanthes scabra]|uniref:RNase H type-1 domain-containing protein n=1 Tax=Stylosanthes scabra TaxID=79078 RepID=A0ABU6TCT3_9FABA|nr:hypothetical protein [Stylosanthes scabra]